MAVMRGSLVQRYGHARGSAPGQQPGPEEVPETPDGRQGSDDQVSWAPPHLRDAAPSGRRAGERGPAAAWPQEDRDHLVRLCSCAAVDAAGRGGAAGGDAALTP